MNQDFTAEEVREEFNRLRTGEPTLYTADMLNAYANLIEQRGAGVTDEVVERACSTYFGGQHWPHGIEEIELCRISMRATLLAVWPNPPAQVDAELYKSACSSVEEWKVRALKAEELSDRLMAEINDMTGPTFMGEPVLTAKPAQPAEPVAQGEVVACTEDNSSLCRRAAGNLSMLLSICRDELHADEAVSVQKIIDELQSAPPLAVPDGWSITPSPMTPIGFRFRVKGSGPEWSYNYHRAPDSFELRDLTVLCDALNEPPFWCSSHSLLERYTAPDFWQPLPPPPSTPEGQSEN